MKYSFGMLNLNIVNSEALADLFQSNVTVKEICDKIQLERKVFKIFIVLDCLIEKLIIKNIFKGDIIFCSKFLYAINTISKCRNVSVPWLFENYSTRLPEKNQEC